MKFTLFALTGFGNPVLKKLTENDFKPDLLVTRREKGDYPYYQEEFIGDLADRLSIPWEFDIEGEKMAAGSDIILVATYHRILKKEFLDNTGIAINLHPSLLPQYKGATPVYWTIRNGEKETGITAHKITENPDSGDILKQSKLQIGNYETQSRLRKRLSLLMADVSVEIMNTILNNSLEIIKIPENGTYYPKPQSGELKLDFNSNIDDLTNQIRAFTDYPGAIINDYKVISIIKTEKLTKQTYPSGYLEKNTDGSFHIYGKNGFITVEAKPVEIIDIIKDFI